VLTELAYQELFGLPLVGYLGIFTFLSFLLTFLVGFLNRRGIRLIPFRLHPRLAWLSITLAFVHGLFALSTLL
jgi:cytochrome b561